MSLQIWKEEPEWWQDFRNILESKLENRDHIILTKEKMKAYLLQANAIDLRDRSYRIVLAMAREYLLRDDGFVVERISKRSLKVMKK